MKKELQFFEYSRLLRLARITNAHWTRSVGFSVFFLSLLLVVVARGMAPGQYINEYNADYNLNYHIDDAVDDAQMFSSAWTDLNQDEFYLISHGKPGMLLIGNQWLGARDIALWIVNNNVLNSQKQLNIYGCEFAKGQKGKAAVAYLENTLAITIAASTNITGKDGDWVLETTNQDFFKSFSNYQYNLQLTGDNDDFDGDGINNIDDIDDDNDGILDSKEQNCTSPSVDKTGITVTTELNTLQGPISNLVNSVSGSNEFYYANAQNIANKEIVKFLFPSTEILEIISFDTRSVNFLLNGAEIEIQGSNNNTTWSTLASFSVSSAANPSYSFSNFMSFTYYRIYGVSGNTTSSPWVDEAHFIRVVSCTDINTDGDPLANRFDTDSDDDGCGDAYEAGTSNNTGASFKHPTSDVGSNGMYNPLETTPDSGVYDGTYTYANAIDGTSSCGTGCTDPNNYEPNCDFDGDGVLNIDDLDDDNDGVLDSVERPSDCPPEGLELFNTHWAFGNKAGLQWDLNNLSALPTSFTNPSINTFEGSAAISHPETGEYLFYTDGATAWSAVDNAVIASGLGGSGTSLQSGVILPVPGGDPAKDYYIFGQSDGFGTALSVSRIDLSLTGTNRKVGATTIVANASTEGVGVYLAANGNYWLAHLNSTANQMEIFEVTSTGVASTPTSTYPQNDLDKLNQIMFSPDGKKIISQGFLYDFDSATGVLSNPVDLTNSIKRYYYAEFSADSRVLFFNNINPPIGLFAYDLSEDIPEGTQTQRFNALEASKQLVLTDNTSRQLSRGVDGRIYFVKKDKQDVGYIELSYNMSDQMTFSTGTISIAPNTGIEGLPTFPTITCKEEFLNVDTDMDGIPNKFDLDSDDDGCSDAYESGATTNTDSDYVFTDLTNDSDGLSPTVDPEEDGTVNYTHTYLNATDNMVNSCPVNTTSAEDDINQTQVGTPVDGNVLTNDSDPEGDIQTVTLIDTDGDGIPDTAPTPGTPQDIGGGTLDIDPTTGEYTFTPDPSFMGGKVVIDYEVCNDGSPVACETASLVIQVMPEEDPINGFSPVVNDDNGTTDAMTPVDINILSNDSDPDGAIDPTTVDLDETSVPGGSCTMTDVDGDCIEVTVSGEGVYAVNETTGVVTFTPDPMFEGETTPLEYSVEDAEGNTGTGTISVEVVEDDPAVNEMTAEDDANSGLQGDVLTGNVLDNDIDPDGSDMTPTVNAATVDSDGDGMADDALPIGTPTDIYVDGMLAGELLLNPDGSYTWNAEPDFVGTVTIPFTVCDNNSTMDACDNATLVLTAFALAEDLPVDLINFNAVRDGSNSLLTWETAIEIDNDRYEVERANDGVMFKSIVSVKGAGTTNIKQDYKYVDENPYRGINYYRLKQVDYDGKYVYSPIRTLIFGSDIKIDLNARYFPNPVRNSLSITTDIELENHQVRLIDMQGRTLLNRGFTSGMLIDMNDMVGGIYLAEIVDANGYVVDRQRIVKF